MKLLRLTDPKQIVQWARKLVDDLSRVPMPEEYPGPYLNDAAAGTAGLKIGQSYMDTNGFYRRKQT